jgi:hypothetical protein
VSGSPFLLREPIGRAWRGELVCLPSPGPGEWHAVDVGRGAPLPSQVSSEGVWVRVDLAPDERLALRVEPGAVGGDGGLRFEVEGASLVVSNGVLSVRVPARGNFEEGPRPGPVVALGRTGEWVGAGVFEGPGEVATEVLDRGPLFARWRTRYGEEASYEGTLFAGGDFVRVRERSREGAGRAFRFRVPSPSGWFTGGFGEESPVLRGPMGRPPPRRGVAREGEFGRVDFHSGHFQMSCSWMGLFAGGHAVGVSEWNGGHWELPGRQRIRFLRAGGGIDVAIPADGGRKEYILACGDPEAYAPRRGASRFATLRLRHSDLPLEKARHWVTDWPLPARDRALAWPAGTADHWEERLREWPELAEAWRTREVDLPGALLPKWLVTRDPARKAKLLAWVDRALGDAVARACEGGYPALNIFDGRALKVALEAVDVLRAGGGLEPGFERSVARRAAFLAHCFADPNFWPWGSVFRGRGDAGWMGDDYFADVGPSICPPNFTTEYWTSFAMVGLIWPEHPRAAEWVGRGVEMFERNLAAGFDDDGGYCESLQYHAHVMNMLAQAGLALVAAGRKDFFEHPRFKRNFGFPLHLLAPRAHLTEAGRELCCAPTMLAPPRSDRATLLANWGNTGADCSGWPVPATVAVAAGIYAERDPTYASELWSAWSSSPREFCTHDSGFNLLAVGRPLGTAAIERGSRRVGNLGAVMRSGEVFAWVKCGPATHHNCRDEGGLVLYAFGAPLVGDFGYHATHEGQREAAWQTWKHACVTFSERDSSAYLGAERALPPERWESHPAYDLLVACLPLEAIVPEGKHYLEVTRVPRIEHRRAVVFLKRPNCFVVFDHIPNSARPSTWWLHALADSVEIGPQRARFRGRYGVDLDVRVLLPSPAVIRGGEHSVQRHIRIDQPGPGDYLTVMTPFERGREPTGVRFEPSRRAVFVGGVCVSFDLARGRVEVES